MYGNDITIINAGITHVITPTIPLYDHFRIVGTATLVGNVSIALDGSFTPTKWDVICFDWEATVTLGTSTVTIFGTTLTKEQCFGKGFIHCMYNGSSWDVRYYTSITDKATGIGSGATSTALTNGGGTITMDITKNDNTLVLTGSPTLSSSWTVVTGGTPTAGDMQIVYYKSTATVGVNTITILGQLLTTAQALAGNSIVISSYDGSSWRTVLIDADVEALWVSGSGTDSCQKVSVATPNDASGTNSFATGSATTASGVNSASFNKSSIASGIDSFASGNSSEASATRATAMGNATTASGQGAMAVNDSTTASGNKSFAANNTTIASGEGSFSKGNTCVASGKYSEASGNASVAHIESSRAYSNGRFAINGDTQRLEVQLKKSTTDATPAYMLLGDGATEIAIPTDCAMKITLQVLATQYGGAGGSILDTFSQTIKLTVKNIAGTSSIVAQNSVTLANYSVVAGNVLYELSSCDATFGGTVAVTVAANTLHVEVTGEDTKSILWLADVSMVMVGCRNYSI